MKNCYIQDSISIKSVLLPGLLALFLLCGKKSFAQTYFYSVFPTLSSSNYSYSQPSGASCAAPTVITPEAIADNSFVNYASYGGLVSETLTCDEEDYRFRTKLNLASKTISSLQGYAAGFVLQTAAAGNIGTGFTLNTYLNGTLQESATQTQLVGLDMLSAISPNYVYFVTTKDFNEVEIVLNESLIPLEILFETRIYFAQARNSSVLPVTITNLRGALQNSAAAISWTSVNEDNVNRYDVERSSDGVTFSAITSMPAKGISAGVANYSYTDNTTGNGIYFYRLKAIDNDGAINITNTITLAVSGKSTTVIYPSLLPAGHQLWIRTETTGMLNIAVYDMQGKLVKMERKASSGLVNISTNNLTAGKYNIRIINQNGQLVKATFIIQ